MSELPEFIGRFPIIDTLGVGGMGVVYSAKDPDIGRIVAIKVLHSTEDDSALERFKNEARTIGEISHPNIVMLLEYGIDKNKPFLVMEYLAGDSLEDWIKNTHELNLHKNILIDLCNALDFAHSKDILHRDLKPGNIQILPSGQAKLLDFGIARSHDTGLTASGFFIGTPKYLAPEILQDTIHTKSSDCYSLGLLAYTMLSGKNPFAAATFEATMARLLTANPVLLHEINPNIPQELSTVIHQYLDKDAGRRPDTTDLLRKTLENINSLEVLSKKIDPQTNLVQLQANNTTIAVDYNGNKTGRLKTYSLIAITLVLISSGLLFYFNALNNNAEPATIKEVADTRDSDTIPVDTLDKGSNGLPNDEIIIDVKNSIAENTPEQKQIVEEADAAKAETNGAEQVATAIDKETITEQTPLIKKPKSTKPKIVQRQKPSSNDSVDNSTKRAITKKIVKQQPDKKLVESQSNDSGQLKNPPINNTTDDLIAMQEKKKTETLPTFTLPQFNSKSKKIKLKNLSNPDLPRGKNKKIRIEIPADINIETFKVLRGRSEFKQVRVRNIKRISDNQIQVLLYAEPNATLGNFSLVGIYQDKKTLPLIMEISL
jgi:serine/threonine protein kinase